LLVAGLVAGAAYPVRRGIVLHAAGGG